MKAFYSYPQAQALLIHCAGHWIDTPWAANSSARGLGVSCHNLPIQIYKESHFLRNDFPVVIGDPNQSKHATISVMEKFLDERSEFQRVTDGQILAGDLLGIRICRCIDHLGLYLGNGFIHVLMHKLTCIDRADVPPWQQRIEAIWRPVV